MIAQDPLFLIEKVNHGFPIALTTDTGLILDMVNVFFSGVVVSNNPTFFQLLKPGDHQWW